MSKDEKNENRQFLTLCHFETNERKTSKNQYIYYYYSSTSILYLLFG